MMYLRTTILACVFCLLYPGHVDAQRTEKLPVLVLATPSEFGVYTAEVLQAEGFHLFTRDSVEGTNFGGAYLAKFDVVILAQRHLSSAQQSVFRRYVKGGGRLIAFRPDPELADVFGIVDAGAHTMNGYLHIDDGDVPGNGLSARPLQIHGETDNYTIGSGMVIASLLNDNGIAAGSPAVVINNFGKGSALAFLFNLPENIVLTRQGNPELAGEETDSIPGIRAMDLFTGGWNNTGNNTINQSDEQMRLLTRCIEYLVGFSRPLPRFWYFADNLDCMVTLNNDGEDSEEHEFNAQFEDVYAKDAKMTLYIKEIDKVSKQWVDKWTAKGFEIAAHPDDTRQAVLPDWNTMDSVIENIKNKIKDHYNIPALHTNTNHWFVWVGKLQDGSKDFAAQALIEEKHGIGLDCNYAHYDNNAKQGHFLGEMGTNQGNYTGSGLTMKFSDVNGKIIDVYQQLNNVYDQQYMEHKDPDGYFNAFKGLMDRSLTEGVYSVVSVKAHNNEYYFSKVPLMKMLDYAAEKKIPVWTGQKYLEYLRARDEATFSAVQWKNNQLSFTIRSSIKQPAALSVLIPAVAGNGKVSKITVDGKDTQHRARSIKGRTYITFTVPSGSNYKIVAVYR